MLDLVEVILVYSFDSAFVLGVGNCAIAFDVNDMVFRGAFAVLGSPLRSRLVIGLADCFVREVEAGCTIFICNAQRTHSGDRKLGRLTDRFLLWLLDWTFIAPGHLAWALAITSADLAGDLLVVRSRGVDALENLRAAFEILRSQLVDVLGITDWCAVTTLRGQAGLTVLINRNSAASLTQCV